MKCEKCGKDLPEKLDYCPNCKTQEANDLKISENNQKNQAIVQDNFCRNCGCKLEKDAHQCFNCNATINSEVVKTEIGDANKTDSGLICLLLGLIVSASSFIFEEINLFFGYSLTLILIVTGLMTTKNKILKAVFISIIIMMILFAIWFIVMMVTCINACEDFVRGS